ncbi:PPM-type phosphatase domain-containing protein [Aphelenchoides fujianensis]|nr:PPM-type phosphatase domain-containing protein [Aphelenchoides fujianensis]
MLAKVKSAINGRNANGTAEISASPRPGLVVDAFEEQMLGLFSVGPPQTAYPYQRPDFLHIPEGELAVTADRTTRPVLCPNFPLLAYAGYAEVCNAGKSAENEDSAAAKVLSIKPEFESSAPKVSKQAPVRTASFADEEILSVSPTVSVRPTPLTVAYSSRFESDEENSCPQVQAAYFGLFDGHAGPGAAVMSANCLHEHVENRLNGILLTALDLSHCPLKDITVDSLVMGALEMAFSEMVGPPAVERRLRCLQDEQILETKKITRVSGGCTVLVSLFFLGRLYVANAGDSRALLVGPDLIRPLSNDFNPQYDRKRLQYLHSDVVSPVFTRLEYSRFLTRKDLNRQVLYRDWFMDGWSISSSIPATKIVNEADLKPLLISSHSRKVSKEGKQGKYAAMLAFQPRLLNTIGVSRGLGDHYLMTLDERILIKPFLSCIPEVSVLDPSELGSLTEDHVVIMASDGLWDVLSNDDAAHIVRQSLAASEAEDPTRYALAAQELIVAARGEPQESGRWKLVAELKLGSPLDGSSASMDDITAFVIPLKHALNMPNGGLDSDDEEMLPF